MNEQIKRPKCVVCEKKLKNPYYNPFIPSRFPMCRTHSFECRGYALCYVKHLGISKSNKYETIENAVKEYVVEAKRIKTS